MPRSVFFAEIEDACAAGAGLVEEAAPEIDGASLAKAFLHVYLGQVPAMAALAAPLTTVQLLK